MSRPSDKAYLAVAATYRDAAPYLREWVEFHLLVGVERFFLYDNFSADDHREVLAPYVEEGIVHVKEWPVPVDRNQGFRRAHVDCLEEHRDDARWIAFLDTDEFLFSPVSPTLPEVLRRYERWPGVGVNYAMFGTSGHRNKPPGLVIENYTLRAPDDLGVNTTIKSIVDPTRTVRPGTVHHFIYEDGLAVDENEQPIESWHTERVSFSRLRINHYWARSEEELRQKYELWKAAGRPRSWEKMQRLGVRYSQVPDDTMRRYVPALKEALRSGRDSSRSSSSTILRRSVRT